MRRALFLFVLLGTVVDAGALPPRLRDAGYDAPDRIAFAPQYPLWSDGAAKQRWIWLPPGASIDASDPDAWEFPPGTRLFKEFSLGRRIETRVIERQRDGSWEFGTYVWNEDGSDARLAPPQGIAGLPVAAAPGGRYGIPSLYDCQACHSGPRVPVLGFSALQLSPDRDPLAPHADAGNPLDLRALVARGLLRNLPPALLERPPRIAATSPVERAALGYLHGNCGHCHGADGADAAVPVDLRLAQRVAGAGREAVLRTLLGDSRFRAVAGPTAIVMPGQADASLLPMRMRSRDPRRQMPPLGTALPDSEALALVRRWIDGLSPSNTHPQGE
jgi:hypothetical protein